MTVPEKYKNRHMLLKVPLKRFLIYSSFYESLSARLGVIVRKTGFDLA
jgi:hypothetical protein